VGIVFFDIPRSTGTTAMLVESHITMDDMDEVDIMLRGVYGTSAALKSGEKTKAIALKDAWVLGACWGPSFMSVASKCRSFWLVMCGEFYSLRSRQLLSSSKLLSNI
jgi:hypothetical protein